MQKSSREIGISSNFSFSQCRTRPINYEHFRMCLCNPQTRFKINRSLKSKVILFDLNTTYSISKIQNISILLVSSPPLIVLVNAGQPGRKLKFFFFLIVFRWLIVFTTKLNGHCIFFQLQLLLNIKKISSDFQYSLELSSPLANCYINIEHIPLSLKIIIQLPPLQSMQCSPPPRMKQLFTCV